MLQKNLLSKLNNWIIFILFTLVIGGVVAASYFLIDYLRKEEIKRIELFATAMKYQQETFIEDPVALDLIFQISESNTSVPVIITDSKGRIIGPEFMRNIPEEVMKSPEKLQKTLGEMKSAYQPFEIKLPGGNQYVYFNNSQLLNDLRYSPLFLGLLVLAYIIFSFWFLRTIKKTDEGFLWAGPVSYTHLRAHET